MHSTTNIAAPSEILNKTYPTPPLIIESATWRKSAPGVFEDPEISPDSSVAKVTTNSKVRITTQDLNTFRAVQRNLMSQKVSFHTYSLPEDHTLKVAIKCIAINISPEKIQN